MNKTFRVAVIGCGEIAANHVAAILASGNKICALCDVDPAQAEKLVKRMELSDVPFYTDYRTLLDEQKPDAIHVCTPHDLHAPISIAALERNVHVLCEKPLCISLEQLEELRVAMSKTQAQLGVCQQNRYEPSMLRLKEMTKVGISGAFAFVVWKRDEKYYRSGAWRGTVAHEGGGVMINQALHTLDMMQWVCGFPTHVTAHVSNDFLRDVIEVEDTASASFTLPDGTRMQFFATTAGSADFPVQLQVKLKTGEMIEAQNKLFAVNNKLTLSNDEIVEIGKQVWGTGHKRLVRHFYECLASGEHFPIDLEEASKVVRLILAMYRSNGENITID